MNMLHAKRFWSAIVLGLALSLFGTLQASAQAIVGPGDYRDFDLNDMGIARPGGITYVPHANVFYTLESDDGGWSRITIFTPNEAFVDVINLETTLIGPVNLAYDSSASRILIYDAAAQELIALPIEGSGLVQDAETTLRYAASGFGAQLARGMVVDAAQGYLYILDAATREIIRVQASAAGNFEASATNAGSVTRMALEVPDTASLQGLAHHEATGHFYTYETGAKMLYQLTSSGEVISSFDLSDLRLTNSQGLVIAPTADSTDDPGLVDLFIADSGTPLAQVTDDGPRVSLPEQFASRTFLPLVNDDSTATIDLAPVSTSKAQPGRLIELYLNPLPDVSAAATTAVARILKTTDASTEFDPPSTDTSGITYIPGTDSLLITDSEINELPLFEGVNLWEVDRNATVLETYATVAFSDEPTDIAYAESRGPAGNAFIFVSDDTGARVVYVVDLGADGLFGTTDDAIGTFSPADPVNSDPEGVTYDSWNDRVIVVDGVGAEVYTTDPGPNQIFGDGDDTTTNFDVGGDPLFLRDPEGIEFDPVNGHLYILGRNYIAETLLDGTLVRIIEMSAINISNVAGLAKAPPSNFEPEHPNDIYLYVVDRGLDEGLDGKLYEIGVEPIDTGQSPPTVDAGPDQTLVATLVANLNATVSDDGLPNPPGKVTTTWNKLSGPGTVTFGDASANKTTATFAVAGLYVLRLTAYDGELVAVDDIMILADVGHNPPLVDAGLNQIVEINGGAKLEGIVSDDGLPKPPGKVTTSWSKLSGPGAVIFGDSSATRTTANFSEIGEYVLRLTATDGQLTTIDEVTVAVTLPAGTLVLERRINANSDDAEERGGSQDGIVVTFDDIEMVFDQDAHQTVGLRFNNIDIPQGAKISRAYIQFALDEQTNIATNLTIQGHLVPNAPTFMQLATANFDITNRPRTRAAVTWTPPLWSGPVNTADAAQRTSDFADVIQEIVNQSQWSSGNSLAIIISGEGERVARSHDDEPASAPLLYIEYMPEAVNQNPIVHAGDDQTITLPAAVSLDGTVRDDGLPSNTLKTTWSQVSGPGSVAFGAAMSVDTSASFSTPGTYVLRLTATDGALEGSDDISIFVKAGEGEVQLQRRIAASRDDAQERLVNSKVDVKHKKLDVAVYGAELVGLRFTNISIPQGSTILSANIQFTADKRSSGSARVLILGQASDNAAAFSTDRNDISSRRRTSAMVLWRASSWTASGAAGPEQQTADLTAIVQEIISRRGWSSGNSLAFLLAGFGKRTAKSWDRSQTTAPLLVITYKPSLSAAGVEQPVEYLRLPMITTSETGGVSP